MNYEKIDRAIELQNRANREIETYGEAFYDTMNELLDIFDSLTPKETDIVLTEYWASQEK
jgi:hypothetical protein